MAGTPPQVRDRAVAAVAQLLGDPTGRCPHCQRLTRLTGGGRIPEHAPTGRRGGWGCPGAHQPDELLGDRPGRPHNPNGWRTDRPLPADHQGAAERPPPRDNREPQ